MSKLLASAALRLILGRADAPTTVPQTDKPLCDLSAAAALPLVGTWGPEVPDVLAMATCKSYPLAVLCSIC
jgi:hypothetical protein